MKEAQHVTLPHALIVMSIILLMGLMVYLKVPEAAPVALGMVGIVVAWLRLNGPKSTDQIVREASLRPPPPTGATEVIEVVMPKAPGLPAPLPREEPKE